MNVIQHDFSWIIYNFSARPPSLVVQVDAYDYLTLVGCLEERSQAFVIKRVGWLVAWNPCRPEGYLELELDSRDDRQVAKVSCVVC